MEKDEDYQSLGQWFVRTILKCQKLMDTNNSDES